MINPGKLNFTIYQGKTFTKTFTLTAGTFDFTDYANVRMMIRLIPDSEVIWDSDAKSSITVTPTTLELTIDAEDTAAFNFCNAGYDIELVKTTSDVDGFARGTIELVKEYTYI